MDETFQSQLPGPSRDFRDPRIKMKPEAPQEPGMDQEKTIGGGPSGYKYK